MLNEKRLTQIEMSLTPNQAVLLWLRQEFQGKTSQEYDRWLIERPLTAVPRIRVERQVVGATQAAMKGQDPVRIQKAARRANMETDFLILLVFRANSVVRSESRSGWLRIGSVFLRHSTASPQSEDASDDLVKGELREAASELFSIEVAVERIQARYFAGECILSKDVKESLDQSTMFLRYFLAALDKELEESGHPELVIDSDEFRSVVDDEASKKVLYICDMAKSEMLQNFGRGEAARAIVRPYILGDQ